MERGAIGTDSSDAVGTILDVDEVLVDQDLVGFLEIFVQNAQEVFPLAPGDSVARSTERRTCYLDR